MNTPSPDLSPQLRAERIAVETLYRAFSEQAPDLVDAVLAPGWDDIPLAPGQALRPGRHQAHHSQYGRRLPGPAHHIHDMLQQPGKIAVRAEISGTHLGELFGIAPTGKKVSFRLHEFHTLANGLVTTTWHMEDWFGLFLQLGQFPPPA